MTKRKPLPGEGFHETAGDLVIDGYLSAEIGRKHHTPMPLWSISAAVHAQAVASRELTRWVQEARAAGYSWETIGQAAGITRQAAHLRWG